MLLGLLYYSREEQKVLMGISSDGLIVMENQEAIKIIEIVAVWDN